MRTILLLLTASALAGCGDSTTSEDDATACLEALEPYVELAQKLHDAASTLRLQNAEACHAIAQELGALGSPPAEPLEAGAALAGCQAAASELSTATSAAPITATWPAIDCAPDTSECASCGDAQCVEVCEALAKVQATCPAPAITASGGDPALEAALEVHLAAAVVTMERAGQLGEAAAVLASMDTSSKDPPPEECASVMQDNVELGIESVDMVQESQQAAIAILGPVTDG